MGQFYSGDTSVHQNWRRIKSRMDLSAIGRTGEQINKYFRTDFSKRRAILMPHWSRCNSKYYWGILTRKGKFLQWKDSLRSNLPKQHEFREEECAKVVWPLQHVTCQFPPCYHKSGPLEGKLIWPGSSFAMDVFKTVDNRAFTIWQNSQMELYRQRIEQEAVGGIDIPEEEMEAMREYQLNHRGSDAVNAQIFNQETNVKKEESKIEKSGKKQLKKTVKVFHNQEEFEQKMWREGVKDDDVIYVNQVKTLQKEVMERRIDANSEIEKIRQLPKFQVEHINNMAERRMQYSIVVNSQEKAFEGLRGKFPSFEQAFGQ